MTLEKVYSDLVDSIYSLIAYIRQADNLITKDELMQEALEIASKLETMRTMF